MDYNKEKYADYYENDQDIGARVELVESQYGFKNGAIFSPTVYYTNYIKQLGYITRVADTAGAELLDIGCGDGLLCEKLKKVKIYTGIDVSLGRIKRCKKRYFDKRNLFVIGDFLNYDFKSSQYDVIVASEIIEHVPDDGDFLRIINSLLKPGGKLIVSTPLAPEFIDLPCNLYKDQHLRCYSRCVLSERLFKNHFKIIKIKYVGFKINIKINKYNRKIFNLVKKEKFDGQDIKFEFNIQSNSLLDRLYFVFDKYKLTWAWKLIYNLFSFLANIFPKYSSQIIIVAKKYGK